MSRVEDFASQDVGQRSGREVEKTLRFLPPNCPPFLSKLLGKTSELQIFPSKLRRNAQKYILIINELRGAKNSLFPTPCHPCLLALRSGLSGHSSRRSFLGL